MKIRFFETRRGQAPVQEYIHSLPARDASKIESAFEDIRERGLANTFVSLRQLRNKLWEIRIQPHRIFYAVIDHDELVLLHAYKKQSQRAPKVEIETALGRLKVLLE
jgi:phage-related protein